MTERVISYARAINEAIRLEMERDPSVFIMGEDIAGAAGRAEQGFLDAWGGPFGITKGLVQWFGPERVRDTPISEAAFLGAGVGAAVTGMRPIVDLMFVDFIGVCLDPILSNASKMRYMFGGQTKIPITITTNIGAGTGSGAQHSSTLYSIFTHLPGLKCVVPSDAYTAKGLMISAIRDDDPVLVFNHKLLLLVRGQVPEEPYTLPLGKARVIRQGKAVTLVAAAAMVRVCVEAAQVLSQEGIDAEVLDLLSLSPLDEQAIVASVRKTKRLVVVDEDSPRCSIATDVAALVAEKAFDYLDAPILRVTPPHTPVPYNRGLEQLYLPNPPKVVSAVRSLFS